jgi:predicted DNA-binding mobile mystery protein A
MKDQKQKLLIQQTDKKLSSFYPLKDVKIPAHGWVNSIRMAMKMSLAQLGKRLGITAQSVKEIETREQDRSITLDKLEQVGRAMNMKLVYGFIPADGSIEKMIENRARQLAVKIVKRTSTTMKLEDQENTNIRIEEAINDMADDIKRTMPKYLWD